MAIYSLGNLTADGSTAAQGWYGKGRGNGTLFVQGSLGGGTVTLEVSVDGTFIPLTGISITAASAVAFQLVSGLKQVGVGNPLETLDIRATIAGSTTPDVDIFIADEVSYDG